MPELDPSDPHRASAGARWHPNVVPFRPYAYRGSGYDIFGDAAPDQPAAFLFGEIPDICTCTWSWGPPAFRWVRIGVKEDCPWHRAGDTLTARVRLP